MADLYHPTRGGTRGGAGEFRWDQVKADKDRENYLGHSINAPTGRWQNKKDVHWYARDLERDEGEKERLRKAEIKRQKELEENALSIALGYGPTLKEEGEEGTGANSIVVPKSEKELEIEALEAEEKKRRKELKAQKKELKKIEKEAKREIKHEEKAKRREDRGEHDRYRIRSRSWDSRDRELNHTKQRNREDGSRERGSKRLEERPYRHRSRSRSPIIKREDGCGRKVEGRGLGLTDRTPPREYGRSDRPARRDARGKVEEYDFEEERAKERRRWEKYHDREKGQGTSWGR